MIPKGFHTNCHRPQLVASQVSSAAADETRQTHFIAITWVEVTSEQRELPGMPARPELSKWLAQQLREGLAQLLVRQVWLARPATEELPALEAFRTDCRSGARRGRHWVRRRASVVPGACHPYHRDGWAARACRLHPQVRRRKSGPTWEECRGGRHRGRAGRRLHRQAAKE